LEDFNNGKKADIIIYVDTTTSIREGLTARCGFASKFNRLSLNLQEFFNLEQTVTSKKSNLKLELIYIVFTGELAIRGILLKYSICFHRVKS